MFIYWQLLLINWMWPENQHQKGEHEHQTGDHEIGFSRFIRGSESRFRMFFFVRDGRDAYDKGFSSAKI